MVYSVPLIVMYDLPPPLPDHVDDDDTADAYSFTVTVDVLLGMDMLDSFHSAHTSILFPFGPVPLPITTLYPLLIGLLTAIKSPHLKKLVQKKNQYDNRLCHCIFARRHRTIFVW